MPVNVEFLMRLTQRPGVYEGDLHPNLVSLTPEEAAKVVPPTKEEIQAAIDEGQKARDEALKRAWRCPRRRG